MKYLYELHCHTAEVSPCGHIPATDVCRLYRERGYSGIIITDHLQPHSFHKENPENWEAIVNRFLTGYRTAKSMETDNCRVFLGAELRFPENDNDYLLYGIDENFLYSHPYINQLSLEECSAIAHSCGVFIVQAHPFRTGMQLMNPDLLDGYEVFNGNKRHNSRNCIAEHWATLHGKSIATSGSDFHQLEDLARGGIVLQKKAESLNDIVMALRQNSYTLIKTT